MTKRNIYCIGESLLDIVIDNNNDVKALAGGSMLNVAVSCARANLDVAFITEYGSDIAGNFIAQFLKDENINTNHSYKFCDGQTALALAKLDAEANATYQFYSNIPTEHLQIEIPEFNLNDIVVFGSIAALSDELSEKNYDIITSAKNAGAIIIYDPNIRPSKINKLAWKERFDKCIQIADVVKASVEDLLYVFEGMEIDNASMQLLSKGVSCVFVTNNSKNIEVYSGEFGSIFEVPKINPISTIGAGDAFNAGLVKGIIDSGVYRTDLGNLILKKECVNAVMSNAIAFSQEVCMSTYNYIEKKYL